MTQSLKDDFIYDNDQSLCDTDGRELVCSTEASPLQQMPGAAKLLGHRRWRTILPFLGVIFGVNFGVILFLVYDVFSHQPLRQKTSPTTVKVAAELQSAPDPTIAALAVSPIRVPIQSFKTNAKARTRIASIVRPSTKPYKPPPLKQEEKKLKLENENPKKESKLVSILKKTGRILKRPFKF